MPEPLPTDWFQIATQTAASLLSAIGGLIVGAWRWGRQTALQELHTREDYDAKIAKAKATAEGRLDMLVGQFKETFAGLRRAIDDDRLHTEQNFVRKDDFKDFREEYRDDMRELKKQIAEISRTK
jgi:hypothetical protein